MQVCELKLLVIAFSFLSATCLSWVCVCCRWWFCDHKQPVIAVIRKTVITQFGKYKSQWNNDILRVTVFSHTTSWPTSIVQLFFSNTRRA